MTEKARARLSRRPIHGARSRLPVGAHGYAGCETEYAAGSSDLADGMHWIHDGCAVKSSPAWFVRFARASALFGRKLNVNPAAKFRQLLAANAPIVIAGAHNGLSARLAERAGFDGIWASGFEISASFAVPDANILSMGENIAVSKQIVDAIGIPVIADCDNGYGNAINVIHMIKQYEAAGIAGICIEDNV